MTPPTLLRKRELPKEVTSRGRELARKVTSRKRDLPRKQRKKSLSVKATVRRTRTPGRKNANGQPAVGALLAVMKLKKVTGELTKQRKKPLSAKAHVRRTRTPG